MMLCSNLLLMKTQKHVYLIFTEHDMFNSAEQKSQYSLTNGEVNV